MIDLEDLFVRSDQSHADGRIGEGQAKAFLARGEGIIRCFALRDVLDMRNEKARRAVWMADE
jgi:hypothetical protein